MKKIYIIFAILTLLSSCGKIPTEFNAPSWQTDLYLPIISKTFTLDTLITESNNIALDESGETPVLKIIIDTLKRRYAIKDLISDMLSSEEFSLTLPAGNIDKAINIPFKNNVKIDSSYFSSGSLYLKLTNSSNGNLSFVITIPGLKNPLFIPFSVEGQLAKNSVYENTFNLTSYSYSSLAAGNISDAVKCEIKSDCESKTGTVEFSSKISNTSIDFFSGTVSSNTPKKVNESINANMGDKIRRIAKGLTFPEPVFELDISYLSQSNSIFDILLQNTNFAGSNYSGKTISLKDKNGGAIFDNILIENGKFNRKIDNLNSNFADIVKLMPDLFQIQSDISLNPQNKSGKIYKSDSLNINAYITLGSKLRIDSLEAIDTIEVNLPDETRELIKSALWAKIYFYAQNALPFECSVNLRFIDKNMNNLFNKIITVKPAEYNFGDEIPSITDEIVELTVSEMPLLAQSNYIVVEVSVNSNFNKNESYELRPKDYLKVKAKCRVKYNVDL